MSRISAQSRTENREWQKQKAMLSWTARTESRQQCCYGQQEQRAMLLWARKKQCSQWANNRQKRVNQPDQRKKEQKKKEGKYTYICRLREARLKKKQSPTSWERRGDKRGEKYREARLREAWLRDLCGDDWDGLAIRRRLKQNLGCWLSRPGDETRRGCWDFRHQREETGSSLWLAMKGDENLGWGLPLQLGFCEREKEMKETRLRDVVGKWGCTVARATALCATAQSRT